MEEISCKARSLLLFYTSSYQGTTRRRTPIDQIGALPGLRPPLWSTLPSVRAPKKIRGLLILSPIIAHKSSAPWPVVKMKILSEMKNTIAAAAAGNSRLSHTILNHATRLPSYAPYLSESKITSHRSCRKGCFSLLLFVHSIRGRPSRSSSGRAGGRSQTG